MVEWWAPFLLDAGLLSELFIESLFTAIDPQVWRANIRFALRENLFRDFSKTNSQTRTDIFIHKSLSKKKVSSNSKILKSNCHRALTSQNPIPLVTTAKSIFKLVNWLSNLILRKILSWPMSTAVIINMLAKPATRVLHRSKWVFDQTMRWMPFLVNFNVYFAGIFLDSFIYWQYSNNLTHWKTNCT